MGKAVQKQMNEEDAPVTDMSTLPLIIDLQQIARVHRQSPLTIRRGLQAGTFRPLPWATYPYRWLREDVEADLRRRRDQKPHRKHGFAAKPKAARAALKKPPKPPADEA